jgi:hypothetical protein
MSSQEEDGSEKPFDPFHYLCRFNLFFRLKEDEGRIGKKRSGEDTVLGLAAKKRMVAHVQP